MKPEIQSRPATAYIGIEASGSVPDAPIWIPKIWAEARAQQEELRSVPLIFSDTAWGLMSSTDAYLERWDGGGRYLAGWEIHGDLPSFGRWSVWRIPSSIYAVSKCTFLSMSSVIKATDEFIRISEDFEVGGAIHEFYPAGFRGGANDLFSLYFTLKQKIKEE